MNKTALCLAVTGLPDLVLNQAQAMGYDPPTSTHRCLLSRHATRDHYGFLIDQPNRSGMWVRWETPTLPRAVLILRDCNKSLPTDGRCALFKWHPGECI